MDRSLDISLPRPRRFSTLKLMARLFAATGRCMERARTRRLLAQLNDQQLHDIGLSHSDRAAELDRPFWR
ncbi:DUF1127 domain-containing protein [Pseudomonas sp. Irchel s3h17]|uniref:DUF1127 domain-containing protein n=1 Tax=Pseudomonas sp. Irchel s3h17 TaxID=2009182 RepID=UPI000BA4DF20